MNPHKSPSAESKLDARPTKMVREHSLAGLAIPGGDEPLAEDPLGNVPLAPELVAPQLKDVTAWDEAAEDYGHRVEPIISEDETESAQLLVEEGMDEAEEELRAAEELYEQEIVREEENDERITSLDKQA